MPKHTKIIATIGPKSESYEMLEKLAEAGMHIARMNFSHCTYDEFTTRKKHLQKIAKKTGKKVEILQDLKGPRIRVGDLPEEGIELQEGEVAVFSTKQEKDSDVIFIDAPHLHLDIKKGHPLYLASGEMELVVRKISGSKIFADVVRGGILYSRKGVNVPDTKLRNSGITAKDIRDIKFGVQQGVEYVAVSFVQSADDIRKTRKYTGSKTKIIAKMETALSLKHMDEIIRESDGIMIARGDLGIEVPVERLPFIQKNLIRHAIWYNTPTITATQMLTSMINHPHPTRAEVSDIANAVFDGTDAVMLSDETAAGQYPVQALKTVAKVVRQAEEYMRKPNRL
jgi:pyruvate kinase